MLTKAARVEWSIFHTPFLYGRIAPTPSQMLEVLLPITLHRFRPQFLTFPLGPLLLPGCLSQSGASISSLLRHFPYEAKGTKEK